jgi:hypothetical protein
MNLTHFNSRFSYNFILKLFFLLFQPIYFKFQVIFFIMRYFFVQFSRSRPKNPCLFSYYLSNRYRFIIARNPTFYRLFKFCHLTKINFRILNLREKFNVLIINLRYVKGPFAFDILISFGTQ